MSFNRAIYDPCEYNKRLDESTSVLSYNLDPNRYYNCSQCRIGFGTVGGNQVSLTACNMVDLESDLRNQTRLYSRCPEKKYLPKCKPNCKSNSGLPCEGCRADTLVNLPECNLVQYKPRIDHIGYQLDYPECPSHPSMVGPRSKPERKQLQFSKAPVHKGYKQWKKTYGIP